MANNGTKLMEECFTTLWYTNCTTCNCARSCDCNANIASHTSTDIALVTLVILESILLLAFTLTLSLSYWSKRRGSFAPHKNEENDLNCPLAREESVSFV